MKPSTTIKLFLAVCFFGMIIWIMDRSVETTAEKKDRYSRILTVPTDEITGLYIENGELKIECAKVEGQWRITSPISVRADNSEIERIISHLDRMACSEIITSAQRTDRALGLGDYGLLFPETRFVVRHPLGSQEILVGKDSPLGDLVYLKLKASSDVIGTDKVLREAVPETVTKLRERVVLHGNTARTSRIEIYRRDGGFLQFAKTDGKWMIKQPVEARANEGNVVQLLDVLYGLKAVEFVWDSPVNPVKPIKIEGEPKSDAVARAELHGLTEIECAARIAVWTEGDEIGKELILGEKPEDKENEVYAKRRDIDSVYTLNSGMLNLLTAPVNEFRDRNLFALDPKNISFACFSAGDRKLVMEEDDKAGWQIIEPVRWVADHQMVQDVVDELARLQVGTFIDVPYTNLAAYGLAEPLCEIQLCYEAPVGENGKKDEGHDEKADPVKSAPGAKISVGSSGKDGYGRYYVMFHDIAQQEPSADSIVTVAAVYSLAMGRVVKAPVDPLEYRDRTLLAVSPGSVKKISLHKHGVETSVVRVEGDVWKADGNVSNQVNNAAVADVLFYTANLRALRIESHNPKDLAPYGLDTSQKKLTLGLDGAEGIQKTLILGFRSKADGVYAMVQGQDVVFVLDNGVVEQLTSELFQPLKPLVDITSKKTPDGGIIKE